MNILLKPYHIVNISVFYSHQASARGAAGDFAFGVATGLALAASKAACASILPAPVCGGSLNIGTVVGAALVGEF